MASPDGLILLLASTFYALHFTAFTPPTLSILFATFMTLGNFAAMMPAFRTGLLPRDLATACILRRQHA